MAEDSGQTLLLCHLHFFIIFLGVLAFIGITILIYNVLQYMWPFVRCCCCRLPLFVAAPLLLIAAAAAYYCQAAAPSASSCSSCSPARAAPSCSALLLQILGRTIVCSTVLKTTPLALANQRLSLLGRTCLTRAGQDSVAASLSIVWNLIRSSDKNLRQTGRIHPDCPCPLLLGLIHFSSTFCAMTHKA